MDEYGNGVHAPEVCPKNDLYGIGYRPEDDTPEYNEMKAMRNNMAAGRKRSDSNQAGIGLSVLEDDDDDDPYKQDSCKYKTLQFI